MRASTEHLWKLVSSKRESDCWIVSSEIDISCALFSGFGPGTWVSHRTDDIGDIRCDDAACRGKRRDLSRRDAGSSRAAETAMSPFAAICRRFGISRQKGNGSLVLRKVGSRGSSIGHDGHIPIRVLCHRRLSSSSSNFENVALDGGRASSWPSSPSHTETYLRSAHRLPAKLAMAVQRCHPCLRSSVTHVFACT